MAQKNLAIVNESIMKSTKKSKNNNESKKQKLFIPN